MIEFCQINRIVLTYTTIQHIKNIQLKVGLSYIHNDYPFTALFNILYINIAVESSLLKIFRVMKNYWYPLEI
jgi:hypothetical protein